MSVWPNGTISKFLCLSQGGGVIGGASQRKTLLAIGWLGQADSVCHALAVLFGFNRHKAHLVRPFLPFLGQLDAYNSHPTRPSFRTEC